MSDRGVDRKPAVESALKDEGRLLSIIQRTDLRRKTLNFSKS
jgi:hypothetical protein